MTLAGADTPVVAFGVGREGVAADRLASLRRDGVPVLRCAVGAQVRAGAAEPLADVMSFYGLAACLAGARGLDPDEPARLTKVTRTT